MFLVGDFAVFTGILQVLVTPHMGGVGGIVGVAFIDSASW